MEQKFVIRTEAGISSPMGRDQAIEMVKQYARDGIEAYILSEDEGERIKAFNNEFNPPKWT
ncbi:hypothetical protein [Alkaliphilus crotonatoxidans]